jgi:hypothetical protein
MRGGLINAIDWHVNLSAFTDSWGVVQSSVRASLMKSDSALFEARRLAEALQHQTVALEMARECAHADMDEIKSLQDSLVEAAASADGAAAREAATRAELCRERDVLAAATQRIADLSSELETMRQMLLAAPRPPRRKLATPPSGSAATPFERWCADRTIVRLEGRRGRRALSPGARRRLGIFDRGEQSHNMHQHSRSPPPGAEKDAAPAEECGKTTGRAEQQKVELIAHPFWSPQVYLATPPSPMAQSSLRGKLGRTTVLAANAFPMASGGATLGAGSGREGLDLHSHVASEPIVLGTTTAAAAIHQENERIASSDEPVPLRHLSFAHVSNMPRAGAVHSFELSEEKGRVLRALARAESRKAARAALREPLREEAM